MNISESHAEMNLSSSRIHDHIGKGDVIDGNVSQENVMYFHLALVPKKFPIIVE